MTNNQGSASVTTLEVLEQGRARIEAGWCKRTFHRGHWNYSNGLVAVHEYCAIGAVGSGGTTHGALMRLHSALPARYRYYDIAGYNDLPWTTKDDILALFNRAIADEKAALAEGQAETTIEPEQIDKVMEMASAISEILEEATIGA